MVTLVGGIIALILGLLGLAYWWNEFVMLVQAGIPLVLILGGGLAAYLGIEEWKDTQSLSEPGGFGPQDAEAERYKAEAEKYKAELQALKHQQDEEGQAVEAEVVEAEAEKTE